MSFFPRFSLIKVNTGGPREFTAALVERIEQDIQGGIEQLRKAREKEKKNQRPKSRSRSDLER